MKFFFACAFLGVLFSFTLAFINKHQKKANKLLSVCLLSIAAYVFHLASINAHLYYKFPAIYAVLLPFQYLIVPTAYLYVRCFLKGNVSFRRRDWVHFIPFILSILLYLKYYFTTNENKLIAIDAADNNFSFHFAETDMLLPVNLLVVIKITLAFTYLFFQWKLIKEWLIEIITAPNIYKDIFSWLKAFTVLISLFIACYAFANLVACYAKSTSINAVILTTEYGLCFSFFAILLNLFFHPKILFGMMGNIVFYALNKKQGQITNKEQVIRLEELVPSKQMAEELIAEEIEGEEPEDDSKVFSLTPEKVTEYKQKLENLMTEQKAFLIHGCNLKDVADRKSTRLNSSH